MTEALSAAAVITQMRHTWKLPFNPENDASLHHRGGSRFLQSKRMELSQNKWKLLSFGGRTERAF
jgi:hypothetical protein